MNLPQISWSCDLVQKLNVFRDWYSRWYSYWGETRDEEGGRTSDMFPGGLDLFNYLYQVNDSLSSWHDFTKHSLFYFILRGVQHILLFMFGQMERGLEKNSNILVRPVKISATAQPRVIMALSFNRKSYAVPYTYSTTACIWSNLSGRVHNLAWGSRKNIWQSLIRECSLFIESSARAEIYLWWYGKYFCVGSVYLCLWCSFKHQILNSAKKKFSRPPLKFVNFFLPPLNRVDFDHFRGVYPCYPLYGWFID